MSRTIRRPNWEKQHSNLPGSKCAGFYTKEVTHWYVVDFGDSYTYRHYRTYRPMTEREKNSKYWEVHGESKSANAYGPSWEYRHTEEKRLRYYNKIQMKKCLENMQDYEPFFSEKFTNHARLWDWH